MRALCDPCNRLTDGLDSIRRQYSVPDSFPAEVLAVADRNATRSPGAHVDRSDRNFVTLDPASSTDLDQAFALERSGADLLLHYAIADIAWFVDDGDLVDAEAWRRGATLYFPDGKAPLYPPILSQGAASLLPDGPRPAVIFTVRVAPDGGVALDSAERAVIHSRAKLAYDQVKDEDLPADFPELARRIQAAEARRGAKRVDPPQQEVVELREGLFSLHFRPLLASERNNAAMSLAANLAIADLLAKHRTGLFRVMAEPDERAIQRLRQTARAFRIEWPGQMSLDALEHKLDPNEPNQAALMLAIRRAGPPASYLPWQEGDHPWHAAMAATYAHATAPLRRLADRYVVSAALALANGRPVPEAIVQAFDRLPKIMAKSDTLAAQIDRAVVDLAETIMLEPRIGDTFAAVVTDSDQRGVRVQLRELPVVARVSANKVAPGDEVTLKLVAADPARRTISFQRLA
ncbi:MAG TPA: RNB domain-containing ribonuclease [Allosphingosinicella sp.]|nr:RNB domain-containing ribonuclease [Allosphingosinicella sp.]